MTETYTDEVEIRGTPVEVWSFLEDAERLASVLPGCERVERISPGVYALVLAVRTPLMLVRSDATAMLEDPEPPVRVRLVISGTPPGFGGTFRFTVPFELEGMGSPDGGPLTRIRYGVDAEVTGGIAMFGTGPVRDAVRGQIAQLAVNVEREIAAGRAPGAGPA
jgi:carbon monoxide dehydrogenase subunit G